MVRNRKSTESLKIRVEDLKRLSAFTPADVSKPFESESQRIEAQE